MLLWSLGSLVLGTLLGAGLIWALVVRSKDQALKLKEQALEDEKIAHQELATQNTKLATELDQKNLHFEEKLAMVSKLEERFENLSQKIFSTHVTSFESRSQQALGSLLNPLKDRIKDFETKVDAHYENKVRDITSLKTQIEHIMTSNEAITKAAQNLTTALKGDVKTQGAWGELVLTRVLEASGLREDHEYTVQGKDMGLKGEEGQHLKPDVIVHLPDGKHIVIDAKVSLTHYEALIATDVEEERAQYTQSFTQSVKAHIDGLSKKKYHHLDKLITPEFVLMFMPVEGAFALALHNDQSLYGYAWNKQIVLVSPTTLLATLRTIESLWKMDRQNQNANEIARQAGALYDKFANFVTDLEDIGKNIDRTQGAYDKALNKLSVGKGNLLNRVETLKTLGAKANKQLPENYLDDTVDKPKELA